MKPSTFVFAAMALLLSSCTTKLERVKPYERGNLANPLMNPDREPVLMTMMMHAYFSREATFGGGGVGGGGCGCN